jgi:hypothetical protein
MREADMGEEVLIRRVADFLLKVLSDYTEERQPKIGVQQSVTPTKIRSVVKPKRYSSDDETTIGDVLEFDKTTRFLDNQYGIRRESDALMIVNSIVNVDESSVITIDGKRFKGTKGLWELLTRKSIIPMWSQLAI